MMDENNLTPQGGEDREVVSWYVPPEQGEEVVRYYVQPQPLPESVRPRAAAPVKKKKKGWVIFVILTAVLAVIIGGLILYMHRENIKRLLNGTEKKIGRPGK